MILSSFAFGSCSDDEPLVCPGTPPRQIVKSPNEYAQEAKRFCGDLQSGIEAPLAGYDAVIVGEQHEKRCAKKYIEEELLPLVRRCNGVVVMEHLSQKRHGRELNEMTPDLRANLHGLDRGHLGCDYGDRSIGTFYSLVNKCFDLKIPVVPLEHSEFLYKGDAFKNYKPRMEILTWRASEVASRYEGISQLWFVGSAHLHAIEKYQYVPGVGDLIEDAMTIYVRADSSCRFRVTRASNKAILLKCPAGTGAKSRWRVEVPEKENASASASQSQVSRKRKAPL